MQSQQQIIIPNAPVHVKVALDNEFRRFLLSPITFEHLYSRLKALYNLEYEFKISFQDDENDWVLITTDQELVYATELSGSPLRLQVKLVTTNAPAPVIPVFARGRGRCGGRGRGGCRGGGLKSQNRKEKLLQKSSRLSARIEQLEAKLNNQLPSERERIIRYKISVLQEKLATVKALHDSLPTGEAVQSETLPVTEPGIENATPKQEEQQQFSPPMRGCHRGGFRGGWRRAMMDQEGCDQPVRKCCKARIAPESIANFRQCKANLQAARESGNAEEINSCLETFRAAKAAKWEARAALRAPVASTDDEQKA
jgi:hypothetical protein